MIISVLLRPIALTLKSVDVSLFSMYNLTQLHFPYKMNTSAKMEVSTMNTEHFTIGFIGLGLIGGSPRPSRQRPLWF